MKARFQPSLGSQACSIVCYTLTLLSGWTGWHPCPWSWCRSPCRPTGSPRGTCSSPQPAISTTNLLLKQRCWWWWFSIITTEKKSFTTPFLVDTRNLYTRHVTCRHKIKVPWSRLRILWTRQHLLPRSWPGKFCNIFLIADCFSLNYWHQHQHQSTVFLIDDHSRQPWVHVAEVAKVKDGKGGLFGKHSVHLLCLERLLCHFFDF